MISIPKSRYSTKLPFFLPKSNGGKKRKVIFMCDCITSSLSAHGYMLVMLSMLFCSTNIVMLTAHGFSSSYGRYPQAIVRLKSIKIPCSHSIMICPQAIYVYVDVSLLAIGALSVHVHLPALTADFVTYVGICVLSAIGPQAIVTYIKSVHNLYSLAANLFCMCSQVIFPQAIIRLKSIKIRCPQAIFTLRVRPQAISNLFVTSQVFGMLNIPVSPQAIITCVVGPQANLFVRIFVRQT